MEASLESTFWDKKIENPKPPPGGSSIPTSPPRSTVGFLTSLAIDIGLPKGEIGEKPLDP